MNAKHLMIVSGLIMGMAGLADAAQINTFGKLEIASDDNTFSARVIGRVFVDGNFYKSGSQNRKLTSGTFIRSARIGLRGNFHAYEYEVEFDNATTEAGLRDARISRAIGSGKAFIGQFKVSESLERVSSHTDLAFMERPYVSEIVPGYKIGVAYVATIGKVGYSANVYNLHESSSEARPTDSGVGATARLYFAPVNRRTMAVHLGGSYAHESTDTDGTRVRVSPMGRAEEYRDGSEFRFVIFDRRNEHAQIKRAIFEGAAVNGPLCVQGEYLTGEADTKTRIADDFTAWYVQGSYVLTGESREYAFRSGEINRPRPSRAIGAVEICARYQRAEREQVANASLITTELGVNYYANNNVRFMVNYGWTDNKLINDDPQLLSMRAQFDF